MGLITIMPDSEDLPAGDLPPGDAEDQPVRVLFLCTGNSCRSIIGEALLNHLAGGNGRWEGYSAGSKPTGQVHPGAVEILARHQVRTEGYTSKQWDKVDHIKFDIIITVTTLPQ